MAAPKDLTIYYTTSELQDADLFSNGPYLPALPDFVPFFPAMPQAAYEHPVVIPSASAPQLRQLIDQYLASMKEPPSLSPEADLVAARSLVEWYINERLPILRLTIFAPALAFAVGILGDYPDLITSASDDTRFSWLPVRHLYEQFAFDRTAEERRIIQSFLTLCTTVSREKGN
ncbi:hypothetical protein MNV49_006167 [Pseudohyphozyma bogoriensis]|nr:hypothetical protein MNV49_006167 [Pseudohyphozyma bogoriensis]